MKTFCMQMKLLFTQMKRKLVDMKMFFIRMKKIHMDEIEFQPYEIVFK